ncbi:MAG: clostripain-related cysteine peptidase [Candidatus Hodarchaeota archaeon]
MKRSYCFSLLLIGIMLLTILHFSATQSQLETGDWTILVFFSADNNLAPNAKEDINELEMIGSTNSVQVLAFLDTSDEPGYLYHITQDNDSNRISSPILTDSGINPEPDMGDPQVLRQFVDYGINHFPSEHLMLVIWDHGQGFEGVSYDYSTREHMSMNGIRETLEGIHLDILIFDACLMGMLEVAYEFRELADYIVFSEEEMPTDGLPYEEVLTTLTTTSSISPRILSNRLVDLYIDSYSGGSQGYFSYVTLSTIKTSEIDQLTEELENLTRLLASEKSYALYATYARFAADYPERKPNFIDLGNFLIQLQNITEEFPILHSQVNSTLGALQRTVLSQKASDDHPSMTGLTFYFPDVTKIVYITQSYPTLAFAQDFSWKEFLIQEYQNQSSEDQIDPEIRSWVIEPQTITGLTPIRVYFSASDNNGIILPQIGYRLGFNSFRYVHAQLVNGTLKNGTYMATIPALGNEAINEQLEITCYVVDAGGNTDKIKLEVNIYKEANLFEQLKNILILAIGIIAVTAPFIFVLYVLIRNKKHQQGI